MCCKCCSCCISRLVGTFSWYFAQTLAYFSHHFSVKKATSGCHGIVDWRTDPACFLRLRSWPPAGLRPGREGSSRLLLSIPPELWTCWLRCRGKNYGSANRRWRLGLPKQQRTAAKWGKAPPWWRRWRTEMPLQWTWGWGPTWPARSQCCSWRRRWSPASRCKDRTSGGHSKQEGNAKHHRLHPWRFSETYSMKAWSSESGDICRPSLTTSQTLTTRLSLK